MARIFGFHDDSGCSYYRIKMPLDALAQFGHHTIQTSLGWTVDCLKYTTIVGQRLGKADGKALPNWRRLMPGRRLVYETDDDVFTVDPTNVFAYRQYDDALYDAIEQAMGIAHVVTVSTPYLGNLTKKYNPNVVVLPNCIDSR